MRQRSPKNPLGRTRALAKDSVAKAPSRVTGEEQPRLPSWLFPVPIRTSRFLASEPAFAPFNIEVAHDRITSFSFAAAKTKDVLLYDLQTQLVGNIAGRHGSGRSGIYRGHYLKGVGRTPAAANWSDGEDVYHGSGHLSVGSAIREQLITAFLQARCLGATIVPCQAVLLGPLLPAEARAVQRGESSSRTHFAASDAHMIALTVKPANFARISNFVFALDHLTGKPQHLGELFLDLERYLHPPDAREGLEGSPDGIARALDMAFRRGLENFRAYARVGLFWFYLNSNFSLDGRFLDLETPLFFGAPFVGLEVCDFEGTPVKELLGFEEFGFVLHWRLFLAWLKSRLRLLVEREVGGMREARPFLRELHREIAARFPRRHLLFNDALLTAQAVSNLAGSLDLSRRNKSRLLALACYALEYRIYGAERLIPDMARRPLDFKPAPATPFPRRFEAAGFVAPTPSRDGEAFATTLARLSSLRDPRDLLQSLEKAASFVPKP